MTILSKKGEKSCKLSTILDVFYGNFNRKLIFLPPSFCPHRVFLMYFQIYAKTVFVAYGEVEEAKTRRNTTVVGRALLLARATHHAIYYTILYSSMIQFHAEHKRFKSNKTRISIWENSSEIYLFQILNTGWRIQDQPYYKYISYIFSGTKNYKFEKLILSGLS